MKNLREYSLFALNLSSTDFITLKNSTRTAKCSLIIGFPVGQEQMNLQQEYFESIMKVKLNIHDLLLFIKRKICLKDGIKTNESFYALTITSTYKSL